MNPEQLRQDFQRDGVVVVRSFLPADQLKDLCTQLDRYIREVVPGLPDSDAFFHDRSRPDTLKQMQRMDHDPWFEQYLNNQRWADLIEHLLGETARATGPEWFNKPPGVKHPTPPHQDNFYFCHDPPNVATMWLALDPVDDENGCLRYVIGSHKHGIRDHNRTAVLGFSQGIVDYGAGDESRERAVHLEPGDLVVHHSETIHRADPNRSPDRHRRAFAMVYYGISAQRDDAAYSRYLASVQAQHEGMGLET